MKLKAVILQNFRRYKNKTVVKIGQLTAIIGRNDSGKSTILDALRNPVQRERGFRDCEHRFRSRPKSVHVQPESVFTMNWNQCSFSPEYADALDVRRTLARQIYYRVGYYYCYGMFAVLS